MLRIDVSGEWNVSGYGNFRARRRVAINFAAHDAANQGSCSLD